MRIILFDPLSAPKNVDHVVITLSEMRKTQEEKGEGDLSKVIYPISTQPASYCGGRRWYRTV